MLPSIPATLAHVLGSYGLAPTVECKGYMPSTTIDLYLAEAYSLYMALSFLSTYISTYPLVLPQHLLFQIYCDIDHLNQLMDFLYPTILSAMTNPFIFRSISSLQISCSWLLWPSMSRATRTPIIPNNISLP